MAIYKVQVLLNVTDGHRFWKYEPGDTLITGPAIWVEADTLADVPEKAWEIGNKMTAEADYDRSFRSISTGDVIVITEGDTYSAAIFAAAAFGWTRL